VIISIFPSNVGLPVNSALWRFSFNIDADTKQGFASNRAGGKSDDIYQLNEQKPQYWRYKQFVEGVVNDVDTKLPWAMLRLCLDERKMLKCQGWLLI
jgi:hypothetical protein